MSYIDELEKQNEELQSRLTSSTKWIPYWKSCKEGTTWIYGTSVVCIARVECIYHKAYSHNPNDDDKFSVILINDDHSWMNEHYKSLSDAKSYVENIIQKLVDEN